MIRQVAPQDPLLKLLTGHPLIVTNIGGRAACPQPQQDFWVVQSEGVDVGFLCRVGETLYTAAPPSLSHEILEFAVVVGFGQLVTDLVLPIKPCYGLLAMSQQGTPPPICGYDRISFFTQPSPQFSAVTFADLQLHSGALTTVEESQQYAVSISHELRNGSAAAVTLKLDGQIVAGATLSHRYNGRAVLGAVAVMPHYRGQGLGHTIVAAACHLADQWGVSPLLCCDPTLDHLYRGVGFVAAPPLYRYEYRYS